MIRVLAASIALWASAAHAQEEEARALFSQGVEAASAERWDEAIDRFQRSFALIERPGTAYNLAVALDRAGRAGEAAEMLETYFRIAPADDSRMAEAQALRTELASRLATLTLTVSPEDASVEIDGTPREGSGGVRTYALDPGAHTIVVAADGYATQSINVSALGGPLAHTVTLVAGSSGGGLGALGIAGIALAGLGLASGGVAIGTGVVAKSVHDDLEARCGGPCPPGNESDIEQGRAMAATSIAFTVIAGVAGIVGVTLLAIELGSGGGSSAALELRPNGVGVRARF